MSFVLEGEHKHCNQILGQSKWEHEVEEINRGKGKKNWRILRAIQISPIDGAYSSLGLDYATYSGRPAARL